MYKYAFNFYLVKPLNYQLYLQSFKKATHRVNILFKMKQQIEQGVTQDTVNVSLGTSIVN